MSSHRSQARRQAAELHRREQQRAARRRTTGIVAGVLVALALLGGLALAVTGDDMGNEPAALPADVVVPKGLVDGGIVTGEADAPVTVTLYEDLQCPACKAFEQQSGDMLRELVDAGTVRLERRPLSFLDRFSTDEYSSRALNALACVVDTVPAAAPAYMTALFEAQPAEGGPGLPDARLTAIAAEQGAEGVGACVDTRRFAPWVEATTRSATESGVDATPTVLVAGKKLDEPSPGNLRAAVERAAS